MVGLYRSELLDRKHSFHRLQMPSKTGLSSQGNRCVHVQTFQLQDMQKHLPDERRFTLGDLIERLDDKGKELGLIIDLTNTERYYKPAVSALHSLDR